MGDLTWTHWDRFTNLFVNIDNPKQTDLNVVEDWRDTFRVAIGLRWEPAERWSVRAGFAYDETTVSTSAHRDPRVPDSDRYWLAFGGGYQLTDAIRVDAGYAHLFLPEASTRTRDSVSGGILRGEFSGMVTWSPSGDGAVRLSGFRQRRTVTPSPDADVRARCRAPSPSTHQAPWPRLTIAAS
jgi:long-chain fatty acid transport protein